MAVADERPSLALVPVPPHWEFTRNIRLTIGHGEGEFQKYSDTYFLVRGYSCDFCSGYTKRYGLLTADGRIVTLQHSVPRSRLDEFLKGVYVFCDDCLDKYGHVDYTDGRDRNLFTFAGHHAYTVQNDFNELKMAEPCDVGRLLIDALTKQKKAYQQLQLKRKEQEEADDYTNRRQKPRDLMNEW